jgi:hypothetical protein
MLLYRGCDDTDPGSTLLASASPTPSTGSRSATPANQNREEQPATNANATTEGNNLISTLITGAVKKDGSGDVVSGAVVVLFKTDSRGAEPQITNAEGQFRFEKVPIRAGVTYSLQTKIPGLCGEESFTSDAVSAQIIKIDLVLRPCQSQAPVSSTQPQETDLTPISQGLGGILVPLNSIKVWLQILATTSILTIMMLLLATLGLVFFGRQQLVRNRIRIDALEERARTFESNLAKHDRLVEPPTALLNVPAEVSQSVQQLVSILTQIATATTKTWKRENNLSRTARGKPDTPSGVIPLTRAREEPKLAPAAPEPGNWYQSLLKGEAISPLPLFAEINSTLTDTSPFAEKQRICFDEQANHGPFVILCSEAIGWIFPTPGANFSPDHHRVFEELDPNNFEQQKLSITPREIIYQDGCWQLVL